MTANRDALAVAAASGFSTATDLADWLVRSLNLPFREAHHVTGTLVALAESKACDLPDLSITEMKSVHDGITQEVYSVPVSYTHLDVYKRQGRIQNRQQHHPHHVEGPSHDQFPENCREPNVGRAPVSYTHLDVYKRQDILIEMRRAGCRAKAAIPICNAAQSISRPIS